MLLVDPNDTFKVELFYKEEEKGLKFFDKKPDGDDEVKHEWFEFRHPNWKDTNEMVAQATRFGTLPLENMDAMALIDAKVRVLLKSWSLKDDNGKSLQLNMVDRLPSPVVMKLSAEMDKEFGPAGILGVIS